MPKAAVTGTQSASLGMEVSALRLGVDSGFGKGIRGMEVPHWGQGALEVWGTSAAEVGANYTTTRNVGQCPT